MRLQTLAWTIVTAMSACGPLSEKRALAPDNDGRGRGEQQAPLPEETRKENLAQGPLNQEVGDTYADIAPIVSANCAGCHNPNGLADFLPLNTESAVRSASTAMISEIQGQSMPPRKPNFGASVDGQRLLQWLKSIQ